VAKFLESIKDLTGKDGGFFKGIAKTLTDFVRGDDTPEDEQQKKDELKKDVKTLVHGLLDMVFDKKLGEKKKEDREL